ncbi:MAG: DUF4859 domain-containing protein [Prevotella sp.]|jgi:hypothetical protein|nr:DUF4859 domain-containing protein [Prevotella sp.]MCH3985918.1 DUF4859 domain-containing protein [Prevotella sp.]MCH4185281.1 DUF4859 domain-containing protein [Prevotella sp.]MCH4215709.1 DUF4859 domain-containing protein [Prevotella sp.]MCI2086955.1 DUF4859 domain-containing protein [Prevotella sp.]
MKKNILYAVATGIVLIMISCSTDPNDAVSKHVYKENESPYLRADTSADIAVSAEFRKGHIINKTILLKDYAEKIQSHLGMTVDDMITGLASGKVVFYNINVNRGCWDKTAPNDSSGWSYNNSGNISDTAQVASIKLDTENKALILSVPTNSSAGVSVNENVGFAVNNGKDYDNYVRFNISMAVSDPGTIIKTISIPTGDYSATEVNFSDMESAIKTCMGMTVTDFNKMVQDADGNIALYMVDANGKWITGRDYTANGLGFWCDANGNPRNWGSGCEYFVETHDGSVGIGRYAGIPSGTQVKIHFVYACKTDNSKYIELVITADFE